MDKKIEELEKRLDAALPENYERWETHEELYEGYQRAFDIAEDVARAAIALLVLRGKP